jgi:dolichol-phosphate mannosyltransferase
MTNPKLSVVVPVYNEKENILPMAQAVDKALKGLDHELIFVDDGSTDGTQAAIRSLKKKQVRAVFFARNFGQTSAIAAGIAEARGRFIATLDGDLQNDPADIPMMLKKLEAEKLDMVAGIRDKRKDGMLLRLIPSKLANILIRRLTGVHIQDYGCTLKVFRSAVAKRLDLFGELHRFIPVLAVMQGARFAQVKVRHHARKFGNSKYGIGRTVKVVSDLLLMYYFMRYRQRPMHFFGLLGLSSFGLGGLIEFYLLIYKLLGHNIGDRPLFYVGILLIIMGVQFLTTGFVAELLMRTYYGSQNKTPYVVATKLEGGTLTHDA